ncbi:MAG: hypothetical protein ACRBBW_14315, partial [Cellvibrionaceae bacterium]
VGIRVRIRVRISVRIGIRVGIGVGVRVGVGVGVGVAQASQESEIDPFQGDMFGASKPHPAVDAIEELNPDNLTPRQALEALYKLKDLTQ